MKDDCPSGKSQAKAPIEAFEYTMSTNVVHIKTTTNKDIKG